MIRLDRGKSQETLAVDDRVRRTAVSPVQQTTRPATLAAVDEHAQALGVISADLIARFAQSPTLKRVPTLAG